MHKQMRIRIVYIVLSVILLLIGTINLWRYAQSTTDENWFRQAPSLFSITRTFPSGLDNNAPAEIDSIETGDLLISIDNTPVKSVEQANELLADAEGKVRLFIHRPQLDRAFSIPVNKTMLPDSFIRKLPYAVYVMSVLPDGASDRAGMKKGDLITKIRNRSFNTVQQADQILRENKAGETVPYSIIRKNEEKVLYLKLSVFGIFYANIIAILVGLFYIACGLYLVLKRPGVYGVRLFSAAFILFGFLLITAFAQREPNYDTFSMMRDISVGIAASFMFPLYFHSLLFFPVKLKKITGKILVPALYILGAIGFLTQLYNINANNAGGQNGFVLITVIVYIVYIIWNRNKVNQEEKLLRRPVFIALFFVPLISMVLFFIITSTLNTVFSNLGYGTIPFILIPLAYLYTIGRYSLLDLEIRLRRNIQYTILSFGWRMAMALITLYAVIQLAQTEYELPNLRITGQAIELWQAQLPATQKLFLDRTLFVLLTFGIVIFAWWVTRAVQRVINRKFHQSKLDFRYSIAEIAQALDAYSDLKQLSQNFTKILNNVMRLKGSALLIVGENITARHGKIGVSDERLHKTLIAQQRTLLREFGERKTPCRVADIPAECGQILEEEGVELLVPLHNPRGKLNGIILLGEKNSEAPFHNDDYQFLGSVGGRLAVALENSLLYRDLAQQERMKLELSIARDIQLSSLPQKVPKIKGLDVAGISIPALEVGGDYFDYLNGAAHKFTVVVGDVSGKGTSSALYMSKIQGILRSLHSFDLQPAELFSKAHTILRKDMKKHYFITALAATFDTSRNKLILARAGHLPLYHYKNKEHAIAPIAPPGLGIGLGGDEEFSSNLRQEEVSYQNGDTFVFITDGVSESSNSENMLFDETDTLTKCILANHKKTASDMCRAIVMEVENFSTDRQPDDDITVVVVKCEDIT